jgi:hypothetical protein
MIGIGPFITIGVISGHERAASRACWFLAVFSVCDGMVYAELARRCPARAVPTFISVKPLIPVLGGGCFLLVLVGNDFCRAAGDFGCQCWLRGIRALCFSGLNHNVGAGCRGVRTRRHFPSTH